MKKQKNTLFRGMSFFAIAAVLVSQVAFLSSHVSAAQIVVRKLTLEAGATDGGSKPGGVVNHFFEFTLPGGGNVGSMKFEYCTTAANSTANPSCVAPTGLSTTTSTLAAE